MVKDHKTKKTFENQLELYVQMFVGTRKPTTQINSFKPVKTDKKKSLFHCKNVVFVDYF